MFEELRNQEFYQLNLGAFADFGGSCPIPQSSISRISEYAMDLFSLYPSASSATHSSPVDDEIESFKSSLLSLFHTSCDKYSVFFFENASAALRMLGHSFPWGGGSKFVYHIDNHNSVLGIRGVVAKNGGEIEAVIGFPDENGDKFASHSLFAFVPQSNFNGRKYPLEWVQRFQSIKSGFTHVLLDCAAYTPSCDLDLGEVSPEFVAISLLKMFGVNGGALIVRNDAFQFLQNFEHVNFFDKMSVVAAYAGLKTRQKFVKALDNVSLSSHVYELARSLHEKLRNLKHYNGNHLVRLYPEEFGDISTQGGMIAFNIFDSKGNGIPHDGIFTASSANNIFVRFGVHCNPGATYMALKWDNKAIEQATRKHEAACSLTASMIDGKFVGSIRVSFGFMSTQQDVETIANFFKTNFLENEPKPIVEKLPEFKLSKVFIHPIKGCHGIEIKTETHRIVRSGLWYDENWGIADEMSTFLDRRRCPKLATLSLEIDSNDLVITSPLDQKSLKISLRDRPRGTDFTSSTVCHEKIQGKIYDPKVNEWFTNVLNQKCVLVRFELPEMKPYRSFFTASLSTIGCTDDHLEQLKPHFVFESETPFIEDNLSGSNVFIGEDLNFKVSRRLPMSTESMIDCKTGQTVLEPLRSICLLHGNRRQPEFGIELVADFVPSRKNPKELKLNSTLHK